MYYAFCFWHLFKPKNIDILSDLTSLLIAQPILFSTEIFNFKKIVETWLIVIALTHIYDLIVQKGKMQRTLTVGRRIIVRLVFLTRLDLAKKENMLFVFSEAVASKLVKLETSPKVILLPWSSLDKEESLACQITSPFNKKIGCFCKAIILILFKKQPSLLLNGGSYLASQWLLLI